MRVYSIVYYVWDEEMYENIECQTFLVAGNEEEVKTLFLAGREDEGVSSFSIDEVKVEGYRIEVIKEEA